MMQGARRQPAVLLVEPQGQTIGAVVAQTVEQTHADLIVIGCHDDAEQTSEVLGPTAQSIVADARVPVQVVPPTVLIQRKPWLQRFAAPELHEI